MSMQVGIDLGGSKIEAIVLDEGRRIFCERVVTPRESYAATLDAIVALVREAKAKVGAGGTALPVGIGIPGAESLPSGLIKNANSTWLIGKSLRTDLEAALGCPVRLANDANCFALSEASDGAAAGARVVFGVILGTGVGGGIVVEGKVLAGANAIAGEWGHVPLPGEHHRQLCYCGRKGCIETYLSGPALAREHRMNGGAELSVEQIALHAANGDADCEATLQRYEARLAKALATVVNILDPDVIVLGGGLSNLDRLYANVPRLWGTHVFSDTVLTRLVKNRHGDSSGVRGAAWLWDRPT